MQEMMLIQQLLVITASVLFHNYALHTEPISALVHTYLSTLVTRHLFNMLHDIRMTSSPWGHGASVRVRNYSVHGVAQQMNYLPGGGRQFDFM